jgi:hypothetical protein
MVTSIRIPEHYGPGLARILELKDGSVRELLAAFKEIPLTLDDAALSKTVASKVDTIPADDVTEIVSALLFFGSFRDVTGSSAHDAAQSILSAIEENNLVERESVEEGRTDFVENMTALLSSDPLLATAKAGRVLTEHERIYRQARVLTDIRPVFAQEGSERSPTGAVITHTLRITTYVNNEHNDFYVVLDSGDVEALIEQLKRAGAKADSIKSALVAAEIPYIDAG